MWRRKHRLCIARLEKLLTLYIVSSLAVEAHEYWERSVAHSSFLLIHSWLGDVGHLDWSDYHRYLDSLTFTLPGRLETMPGHLWFTGRWWRTFVIFSPSAWSKTWINHTSNIQIGAFFPVGTRSDSLERCYCICWVQWPKPHCTILFRAISHAFTPLTGRVSNT